MATEMVNSAGIAGMAKVGLASKIEMARTAKPVGMIHVMDDAMAGTSNDTGSGIGIEAGLGIGTERCIRVSCTALPPSA